MKDFVKSLLILGITISIYSCKTDSTPTLKLTNNTIIPKPLKVEPFSNSSKFGSSFEITSETTIYCNAELQTANQLATVLKNITGHDIEVKQRNAEKAKNAIYFSLVKKNDLGNEGYRILITEDHLTLFAGNEHGLFNGIQTFRQLIEPDTLQVDTKPKNISIETGTITDQPEYEYRGAMLDVSRHFFAVKDVKRYIDLISQYKINHLHLHLSDDQGWRIEIKSWPNLTTHGGRTEVGGGKGGFYTQEDYKEIVAYAGERFVTIVPEIDMPGHTNSALASYPELTCDGKAPELYTGIEVGFSTLCTKKEIVYDFIDDVVRELAEMTPGPYIHIGGDESLVTELKDYIPFIERTAEIVQKHGKQVIGWDEIAHAKLPPNSVVQFWDAAENAKKGIDQNAKVLMSPANKTYLDMQYDSTSRLGLNWAAYIEIDSAYNWEPSELIEGVSKANILGVESPLWSETIINMDDIEYLAFPRIICHSEIGWTPKELRKWNDFKVRLGKHKTRLVNQNIDYYPSKLIPWQ